jgi:hypothetical protein
MRLGPLIDDEADDCLAAADEWLIGALKKLTLHEGHAGKAVKRLRADLAFVRGMLHDIDRDVAHPLLPPVSTE